MHDNIEDSIIQNKRIHDIIEHEEDTWLTKRLKAISIGPIKRSLKNPKKALL